VEIDPFILSRLQFALNISFHILFPTISIGLCWILLFFRLCFTYTQDKEWEYAYYFWIKIFALTFAIGVVSGITMDFPGFTRHFLAWKNSLLQIWPEKHLQCDYVV